MTSTLCISFIKFCPHYFAYVRRSVDEEGIGFLRLVDQETQEQK